MPRRLPRATVRTRVPMPLRFADGYAADALVHSFDGLVGNCPTADANVMDFVGYGNADCREGTATAPSATAPGKQPLDIPEPPGVVEGYSVPK